MLSLPHQVVQSSSCVVRTVVFFSDDLEVVVFTGDFSYREARALDTANNSLGSLASSKCTITADKFSTPRAIDNTIALACTLRSRQVVAADEKEAGLRATLNLGHTFGHAIEV